MEGGLAPPLQGNLDLSVKEFLFVARDTHEGDKLGDDLKDIGRRGNLRRNLDDEVSRDHSLITRSIFHSRIETKERPTLLREGLAGILMRNGQQRWLVKGRSGITADALVLANVGDVVCVVSCTVGNGH